MGAAAAAARQSGFGAWGASGLAASRLCEQSPPSSSTGVLWMVRLSGPRATGRERASDESFALLHAAGWFVGELRVLTAEGRAWRVSGTNGENAIDARASARAEAWQRAVESARSLGMPGLAGRPAGG